MPAAISNVKSNIFHFYLRYAFFPLMNPVAKILIQASNKNKKLKKRSRKSIICSNSESWSIYVSIINFKQSKQTIIKIAILNYYETIILEQYYFNLNIKFVIFYLNFPINKDFVDKFKKIVEDLVF